jgi:tRNA(fMet)-specific endonuclease VapC
VIADTDVLIDLMEGEEGAIGKVEGIEDRPVRLHISSVSLFELYHSVERVRDAEERRRRIEVVLDSKPPYPADAAVMKKAGRIDGRLASAGRAIGIGDTIIAGTALVHEESVLTRNTEHFERIDGLSVESYLMDD